MPRQVSYVEEHPNHQAPIRTPTGPPGHNDNRALPSGFHRTHPLQGLEHGPNCGGELQIVAAILELPVLEKILTHLVLQARAPPRAPAPGQALQAEPGHQQSSGPFVPGEKSGRWPGVPCKVPDAAQPCPFRTRRLGPLGSAASEAVRVRWMWPGDKG